MAATTIANLGALINQAAANYISTNEATFVSTVPGPEGPQGIQGIQGIQGLQGTAGIDADPLTVTTITLNPDKTLYIAFSDGTSYTTASLEGPQGVQGSQGAQGVGGIYISSIDQHSTTDPAGIFAQAGETDTYAVIGTNPLDDTTSIIDYIEITNGVPGVPAFTSEYRDRVERIGVSTTTLTTTNQEILAAINELDTDKFEVSGGTISGDVVITGTLTVQGATTTVESQIVTIADNTLVLNSGEVGTGVTAGSAGIEIDRGLANNYFFIFDETDDAYKIGEAGSLQKVGTREDIPTDAGIAVWDAATNKFVTTKTPTVDTITVNGNITVTGTVDGRDVAADGIKLDNFYVEDLNISTKIGDPTHIDRYTEIYNHMYSSGVLSGCDITDNLDGTISLTAGTGTIRATGDNGHGTIYSAEIPAANNLVLADQSANYVYASYNDGVTITIGVSQNDLDINLIDIIPICVVVREGTVLHILDARSQNVNHIAKNQIKEFYTRRFERKNGGVIISDKGTRHIGCTVGAFYFQLDEYPVPALDTTGVDTIEEYKHVGGTWVETEISQLNNQYYDNGTDLVLIGNNNYGVHWVYAIVGTNPHYAVVYGTQEYANLASAEVAAAPTELPKSVETLGVLIGRVIFEKDAAEFSSVETAFSTSFISTAATSHNNLAGLQGGALNDYYHLTNAELLKLSGIEVGATADQIASEVPVTPVGNLTSNTVQLALEELQGDLNTLLVDTEW